MSASSFDRVHAHLQQYGERTPMRLDQIDDLETMATRLEEVRRLRPEYAHIKLSSYMETLLGMTREAVAAEPELEARIAVSV